MGHSVRIMQCVKRSLYPIILICIESASIIVAAVQKIVLGSIPIFTYIYIPGVPTSSGQDFSKKGGKIVKVCLHFSFTLQITLQFDELFVVPISCDFDINPEFVGTPGMNLKILSSLSRISRSHFCCMVSFSDQSRGTKSLSLPRHEFSNITRCASE